jgi:hypothetical protein
MKEKLKKYFSKYKEYFYIILIIILLISFFCFFWFSKENMDKLFYSYLLTTLIYLLFFRLDLFERYIIRNITIILIFWIIFIMYTQTFLWINNKDTLLMVWWIIAFWYWYKRYERDKELEMLDKYIMWNLSTKNIEEIKKRRIWFLLNEKWYIKKWLWDEIDIENQETFFKFLDKNLILKLDNDFSEKFTKLVFPNKTFEEYIKNLIKSEIIKKEKYLRNKKISKERKELIKEELKQLNILIKVMEDFRKIINN